MYDHIRGTFITSTPQYVVVEAGGIGYRIAIPASAYGQLQEVDKEVTLYTSLVIRENSQTLFGFCDREERHLFEVLITVSGIGPKIGLAMIGHLPLPELQQAIAGGDIGTLSRVPGIGKRTAERLVVELKDKLPSLFPRDPVSAQPLSSVEGDAISALVNLGYSEASAKKAVRQVAGDHQDLPAMISSALKQV